MSDVPDTELLSAYLDGELTADEQVRAEQILAVSPEARQLLEELRALGNTLQGLPQLELDEDLSASVLAVAERRMLLSDDTGDKPSAGRAAETLSPFDAGPTGWPGIPWREISWRGMFSKRALIWSAVVVTTGIIIHFSSPPPQKANHQIAKTETETASRTASAPGDKRSAAATKEPSWEAPAGQLRQRELGDLLAMNEKRKAVDSANRAITSDKADAEHVEKLQELEDKVALRAGEESVHKLAAKRSAGGWAKEHPMPEKAMLGSQVNQGSDAKQAKKDAQSEQEKLGRPRDLDRPREAVAESRPAPTAAPMPEALPPTPPSQPKPAVVAAARPAADSPPRAVATANGPAAANPSRGAGKAAAENAEVANNTVSRAGAATQLMSGSSNFGATNSSVLSTGTTMTSNLKGDRAGGFGGQMIPASTVVNLNVSLRAAQDKVFEKLLTSLGLSENPNAANNDSRRSKMESDVQAPAATSNLELQYKMTAKARADNKDEGHFDDTGSSQRQAPKPLVVQCDASPEQLGLLLKHVGEDSASFAVTKVEASDRASPEILGFAQYYNHAANNNPGGGGGESWADRPGVQQQGKADAKDRNQVREETAAQAQVAQAQAPLNRQQAVPPAVGVAKQHVVFVLNVVDHIAPAAGAASPAPAAAPVPATPAKPK